jgi:hypothetical protein
VPPGVGSEYGHFEVLGGGVLVCLTRGVTIQVLELHRGPEYANQTVTRRLNSPRQNQSVNLILICHSDRFLFLCIRIEMINIAAAAASEYREGTSTGEQ